MCTQGHLGEGGKGDAVKWLRKPRSREDEALHTFKKFTPPQACSPATVLSHHQIPGEVNPEGAGSRRPSV